MTTMTEQEKLIENLTLQRDHYLLHTGMVPMDVTARLAELGVLVNEQDDDEETDQDG